jgi:surface antigen
MAQNCYSIEKHHNRWSVSVFGVKVLICDSKKMALAVVRQATQALVLDGRQTNGRGTATEPNSRDHAETPCNAAD